jgi:Major Facilitator Superfamily
MATAALPKPEARGVFAQRDFRTLWLAQFVSVFGDFLALFGVISLITFRWHGTAAQVTYLLIAYMLPLAIVGPISGVFVDRWRVKQVMISSDLIRGALVLLLPWVTDLEQLCAIFIALSVVSSFFAPAQSVALRTLVAKDKAAGSECAYVAGVLHRASALAGCGRRARGLVNREVLLLPRRLQLLFLRCHDWFVIDQTRHGTSVSRQLIGDEVKRCAACRLLFARRFAKRALSSRRRAVRERVKNRLAPIATLALPSHEG